MPRQARIDYPGALHHVIGRGIERKFIFKEDEHKREFYRRLADNLSQYSVQCYAWCIMGNHFHLLLQTGDDSVAKLMRAVLTGYAVYYNRKHKRSGYLFQNRYKAVLCDRDEYLLSLIRYIHLNPVKANMITYRVLEKYSWTGHRELCLGEKGLISSRDEILSFYGRKKQEAIQSYKQFVKDGVELEEDFEGGGLFRSGGGKWEVKKRQKDEQEMSDERILGNGGFVAEVLERVEESDTKKQKIKSAEALVEKISKYYEIPKDIILKTREKRAREARDMFLYMGSKYTGKKLTELGRMLNIGQSAASHSVRRARQLKRLEKIMEEVVG